MSHILQEHKTEITVGCIITIAVSIVYCLYLLLIAPTIGQSTNQQIPPPPIFDQNGRIIQRTTASQSETPPSSTSLPIISAMVLITLVTTSAISIFLAIRYMNQARLKRDQKRLADLPAIAQAFHKYKQDKGTYPISSTYQSGYYTAINLSNDWHYYGLPNDDQMRHYLPEWPVSDPGIDYHGKSQANQYLYYPRDNGARFDLYAHLELHEAEPNYNQQDNLPLAWGNYNYKISSDSPIPAAAAAPAPVVASQPVIQAPPPQPAPQAMPTTPVVPDALPQSLTNADTDIEPQAATAAASASLSQNLAEQQAVGAIDQLFAQDQLAATPPAPVEPVLATEPPPQPAKPTIDPQRSNSNQLDQLAQAMAARSQITDGSSTPEITTNSPEKP